METRVNEVMEAYMSYTSVGGLTLPSKESHSERLRKAMKASNMKAIELSRNTGINRSSISEYLSGSYEPKPDKIFKMAKALGVSPAFLMGVTIESF